MGFKAAFGPVKGRESGHDESLHGPVAVQQCLSTAFNDILCINMVPNAYYSTSNKRLNQE